MGRPSGAWLNELPKRTAQGAGVWLCLCGAWVRSVAAISGPLPNRCRGASRVRGWGVVGFRSRHSAGDKRVTGGDGGRGRCLSARQEPERPSSTRTHVFLSAGTPSRGRVVLVFRSSYAGTAGTRYRLRPLNTGPTTTPPRGRPHAPHGDPRPDHSPQTPHRSAPHPDRFRVLGNSASRARVVRGAPIGRSRRSASWMIYTVLIGEKEMRIRCT